MKTYSIARIFQETSEIITARHKIAKLALGGNARYSFDPIGDVDGDINSMATLAGLPLVYRAESDNDVAVYSNGTRHVLVCDAHGPVAIRLN